MNNIKTTKLLTLFACILLSITVSAQLNISLINIAAVANSQNINEIETKTKIIPKTETKWK